MRSSTRLAWLAASAGAFAAAWAWPPLMKPIRAADLSLRLPAGWSATGFPAGEGALVRVEGGRWPPLLVERHRGLRLDPLAYAGSIRGRRDGLSAVRLGGFDAFRTRTREGAVVEQEDGSGYSMASRERVYFVFRGSDALFVASYQAPRQAWDRWRAERTYRRILSTLKEG